MILRLLIFLFLYFTPSFSQTIIINENNSKVSIIENSSIYIDSNSTLDFEEIRKKEFKPTNTDYIRLGYTSSTVWLKFKIKNLSNKSIKRYITITNNMPDVINLYTKQQNKSYKVKRQGVLQYKYYSKDNILHANFKIEIKSKETKEFYYKVYCSSSANFFQLYLKTEKELYKDEFSYQLILSLFIGAMIAFIFYNIFIYYFTKEKTYLYYVIYIFFITWNHISYSSMSNYFITSKYLEIEAFAAIYYISIANIFSILFIKSILETKQYKVIDNILNSFIVLNIFLIFYSFIDITTIEYISLIIFIAMLFLLFVCFYSFFKNNKQSKYILIGWTINVVGITMLYLVNASTWSLIDYFPYFYELTVFLEAILFSIALAAKLNKTKELEESVATNEVLARELHHRVKNNMQFIILMYRLKLANLTTNEIDEKLKETEGSIQAMSKTHEILYNQENLEDINTKLYFENLIDELKRSFHTKNITINQDIKTTIDTQQAIYCGIILNELITNSFKYAFVDNNAKIDISLEKKNNSYEFIISDNGIGFDYKEKSFDSFGLSFVKAMVEDELKGNITFNNNQGTNIKILF